MAEKIQLPDGCGKVARLSPRKATASSDVVHELAQSCSKVAAGAEILAGVGHILAEIGPGLGQSWAEVDPNLSMWANVDRMFAKLGRILAESDQLRPKVGSESLGQLGWTYKWGMP